MKLDGPGNSASSGGVGEAKYILEAKERLLRIAESIRAGQTELAELDLQPENIQAPREVGRLESSGAPALVTDRPRPQLVIAPALAPSPVAAPAPVSPDIVGSINSAEELRAAIIDRVVDKLADRVIQEWEQHAATGDLNVEIAAKVVDRLVSRLRR